jgi:hypothetical protein
MVQQELWLLEVVVEAEAANFLQDKTIKVPLVQQEPRKAGTDKAKAAATVLVAVVAVVAKMVVRAG